MSDGLRVVVLTSGAIGVRLEDMVRARTQLRVTWRLKRELRRLVQARRRGSLPGGLVDILPDRPVT